MRLLKIHEPFFLIACTLKNISTQGECDAGDRVEEQAEWGAKPGKPGIIIIIIITIREASECQKSWEQKYFLFWLKIIEDH